MSRKLRSAYRFIRSQLDEIGLASLDISHGDILYQLYFSGQLTMTELASKIDRDKSTVTALVRKLTKLELIALKKDPEDKRIRHIVLTEKGEGFREEFLRISDAVFQILYRDMESDQQQQLIGLMKRLGEEAG